MTPRNPEGKLEDFFYERVRRMGGKAFKLAPTEAGIPDRLVAYRGKLWLVELKTSTGDLSPIQKHQHHKLLLFQGIHVVVLAGRDEIEKWCMSLHRAFGELHD